MITPFEADGSVDYETLEKHATWLYEQGVSGIAACGSTGEHEALTFEEKVSVYELTVKVGKTLNGYAIAGMGGGSTADAIRCAQAAEEVGADIALVLPPFYYGFTSEEIVQYFKDVANSTKLQIMIYNNPGKTRVNLTPEMFAEISAACPNVTLTKDSTADVRNVMEVIEKTEGRVSVFSGWDSIMLESLYAGAIGVFSGGGGNICPAAVVKLYNLVMEKKYVEAMEYYRKLRPLLVAVEDHGRLSAWVKAATSMSSPNNVGVPRKPYFPASEEETALLRKVLVEAGII